MLKWLEIINLAYNVISIVKSLEGKADDLLLVSYRRLTSHLRSYFSAPWFINFTEYNALEQYSPNEKFKTT